MDEGFGYVIGGLILLAIVIYVLVMIAAVLLALIGIAAGIGIVYGGGLALRVPIIYFSHLFGRTKAAPQNP